MPEGPELHLASRFINQVCDGRIFGKIAKSEISKNPVVCAPSPTFSISASSRGKELKLILHGCGGDTDKKQTSKKLPGKLLDILVTFGLAGKFEFVKPDDLAKHAHLNFYTADNEDDMVLSFVDYMRFGRWTPGSDFTYTQRGPCVLTDYIAFREHALKNLNSSAFNKPICELLLNQKYFNGIGNYLRAEILHRAEIPPFVSGRSVIEPLACETVVKSEKPDILELCHILPQEVIALEGSWYDAKDRENLSNAFNKWLQCYYQDDMNNLADHNKRTIWFSGQAGPMAPEVKIVRGKKKTKPRQKKKEGEESDSEDNKTTKSRTKRSKKKAEGDSEPRKKKIKTENVGDKKDSPLVIINKPDSKEDLLMIQELSQNMHSTRLTRRKLRNIIDKKAKISTNGDITVKVEIKSEMNGNNSDTAKTRKTVKRVLNNGAAYLNSSKQTGQKRRKSKSSN